MTSANVRATAHFTVTGCKMHRQNVQRLWRAIRDGMNPDGSYWVSTERSITRIQADNLERLVEAVAESSEPGDPEMLDNLWMMARERTGPDRFNREVRLTISQPWIVSCTVEGDPTWVRGHAATLQALLNDFRPIKRRVWYAPRISYLLFGACASSSLFSTASIVIPDDTFSVISTLALYAATLFLGGTIGGIAGTVMSRKTKVQIWPTRDEFPKDWLHLSAGEVTAAVVAALAIVATVIFGVIAHSDAKNPEALSSHALIHCRG